MKVVFLDIDGCLNHQEFIYSRTKRNQRWGMRPANKAEEALAAAVPPEELQDHLWYFRCIEGKKVKLLDKIVQRTGAKVVISSSWRRGASKRHLALYLRCLGFSGEVIGATPTDLHCREEYKTLHERFGNTQRGWEIQEWLREHPEVSSFVILDDESDMDGVQGNLVQTSFESGLTKTHIERAIAVLLGQPRAY